MAKVMRHHNMKVMTEASWKAKRVKIKKNSKIMANRFRKQDKVISFHGREIVPCILASNAGKGGKETRLRVTHLELDWKISKKIDLMKDVKRVFTKLEEIDLLDRGLPVIFGDVLEGKGLYHHSIGEFFELYGKFEERHDTEHSATKTRLDKEMERLGKTDERYYKNKRFIENGAVDVCPEPLPYGVRNILAHQGTEKLNYLDPDGNEIEDATKLLEDLLTD